MPPVITATHLTVRDAQAMIPTIREQRALRPLYKEQLAQAMIRGEWRWNADVIAFSHEIGDPACQNYNGQHRIFALFRAGEINPGIEIPALIGTGYDPDVGEVLDIGKPRTLADTLDFIDGPAERPGHRDIASSAMLAWHLREGSWSDRQPAPTRPQLVQFVKNDPGLADAVVVGQQMQRELHGSVAGYCAAIWLMARGGHPGEVEPFAEAVTFAEGLRRGDPAYEAHHTLLEAWGHRSSGPSEHRRGWWYAAILVQAWNEHVTGKRSPT